MPRWLPRALVLVLALVAAFQLGSWAFHQLTGLLINILIAFFLALAIEPAVSWMASRGMRRGLATFIVFIGVMIASAGFVTLLGSVLADQIIKLIEGFPAYLDSVINWINTHFKTDLKRVDIQEGLLRSDWLRNYVQNSATGVLDVSAQVIGGLFQLLTIALFSFYFAADGPRLRRAICSVLPPARQAEVRREQARRAAARREAQRRLAADREAVRRAAMGLDRESPDLPAAANGGSVSYRRRGGGLRGRAYEAGGRHHTA